MLGMSKIKVLLIFVLMLALSTCTVVNDSNEPVIEPSEEIDIVQENSDTIAEIKKEVTASNNSTLNNPTPDDMPSSE